MKKLSIIKILFLLHIILLAGYYFYHFHYSKIKNDMTSHLPKQINRQENSIEIRPRSYSFKEENTSTTTSKTTLEILNEAGANYIEPQEKLSLLMIVIQNNERNLFNKIISDVKNIDHQNAYGATALVLTSSEGDIEFTKKLLNLGANPNIVFNKMNFTLLMDAAIEGNIDILQALIASGATIDAKDKEGMTALAYAAKEGHLDVVKYLLDKGANKKIKDKKELTPLDYAIQFEHKALFPLLK